MKQLWILGALAMLAPALHAADCSALKSLALPDTTIETAESVTSGTLVTPTGEGPFHDLPPFCRVTGVLRPSADSIIRFEAWLPAEHWNGRFLGVGNGGFAGAISDGSLAANLNRGFATAGSDTGHQGEAEDASWAFHHPEKIKDFGWRAVHLTAQAAKSIIQAYYAKPAEKSYFDACSDGGREALMEAQRFPADYDGILAGAPANNWAHMLSSSVALAQKTLAEPRAYISSLKLPAVQRAVLAQCDAQDGVSDGILNNPPACHFDPQALLCKSGDNLDCLTQPQVDGLKALYAGGHDSHGNPIFPGFAPGDEARGWPDWIIGHGPGSGSGSQYVENFFRYMVTNDPKWNLLTANVDQSLAQAMQTTAADLDAANPDLTSFAKRGGKLILYHGWDDPAISPLNSIAYVQSVEKRMGAAQADTFLRLFMAPGMEHCVGGPGPDRFGQLGIPTEPGPEHNLFEALENWVEKGTPVDQVIASKISTAQGQPKVLMARPLCPYPQIAKYKGSGDTNDAASFACGKE